MSCRSPKIPIAGKTIEELKFWQINRRLHHWIRGAKKLFCPPAPTFPLSPWIC
jgi:hypothetical protein